MALDLRNKKKLVRLITADCERWNPGNMIPLDHVINYRAKLAARWDVVEEDGKLGQLIEGMDCDSCQYRYEAVIDRPRSVVAWCREQEHHESYLDGPESTTFHRPSEMHPDDSWSRDRALEAFEDGHPHVVYMS